MAMLVFLAMSCLIVSAIFLTIGFFEFLEPLEGYTGAAFGVGGLYLVAALICMLVIARERPASPRQASAGLMEAKESLPSQKAEFANNIETVAPFLDILKEAGMERERLASRPVRNSRNNCILSRWSPSRCLRASSLAVS